MKHAINNQKKADRFNYNFSFYKENEIKHIISMLLIVVYLFCVCFFSLNPYNNNNFIHFYLKKKKRYLKNKYIMLIISNIVFKFNKKNFFVF